MTAVDTNILVYSHRVESPFHVPADDAIRKLVQGAEPWAIPWPCIYEFLNTVTNPRRSSPPTPTAQALAEIQEWLDSPGAVLLSEPHAFFLLFREVIETTRTTGPAIHDARIAALCHYHGVDRLYTADRDFSRFGNYVRVENPLLRPRPSRGIPPAHH